MNLTTIARVKGLMDIEGSGDEAEKLEDILRQIIHSVSKSIENSPYFDRHIKSEQRSEQFDVEYAQGILSLKGYPINGSADFKVWSDSLRAFGDSTLLDSANYYVDEESGIIKFDKHTLTEGRGTLKVQYTGGLAVSTDVLTGTITGLSNTFTVGEVVVGGTSGARGTLISQSGSDISISVISGEFVAAEPIAGRDSTGTCTLATITQTPLITLNPDLVHACDLQASFIFQRRGELGLKSSSLEGGSISTYQTLDFLPEVKRILRTYKRVGDAS